MKDCWKLSGTCGIVVAIEEERNAFLEIFGEPEIIYDDDGYEVSTWLNLPTHCRVYLVLSGYGEIAAASATQYLIDVYNVDRIINYGVVGGLHMCHTVEKVGIVKKIVHYGFDVSADGHPVGKYPNQKSLYITPEEDALPHVALSGMLPEFVCASADKFVDGGDPKRKLRKQFGADVCEMEAAGIVITCNRNHVPCSFIKAVSDGVNEGGEAFDKNATPAAKKCVEIIAYYLL